MDFDPNHIVIDADRIEQQASDSSRRYLFDAIKAIDKHLGAGFAAKNPALIAAFMQASATDYAGTIIAQQLRAGLETIADAIGDEVAELGRKLEGAMSGLDEVGTSIQNIAATIDLKDES